MSADNRRSLSLPELYSSCDADSQGPKLKCDVTTEPEYQACERCRRLKLSCRIDKDFRRVGKRSEKAQMEKEIMELRAQLASTSQQSSPVASAPTIKTPKEEERHHNLYSINQDTESGVAVASLMDLANGASAGSFMKSPDAHLLFSRRLGSVSLNRDQIQDLFHT